MLKIELIFDNDNIKQSEIIYNGFILTEKLHNNLKNVDDNLLIKIPYNVEIADCLKRYEKIKARLLDENNVIFAGYLRNNFKFQKEQKNLPIQLEIISPSFLIKKKLNEVFSIKNETLSYIIETLLNKVDLKLSNNSKQILSTINMKYFFYNSENINTVIEELLLEVGYLFKFNKNYELDIYSIYPEVINSSFLFNGENIRENLTIEKQEENYKGIALNYTKIEQATETPEIEFSFGDNEHLTVFSNAMSEEEKKDFLETNKTKEAYNYTISFPNDFYVVLCDSFIWQVKEKSTSKYINLQEHLTNDSSFEIDFINKKINLNLKIKESFKNNFTFSNLKIKFNNAFLENGKEFVKIDGENQLEKNLKYIHTFNKASNYSSQLANKLYNYYRFSDFKATLKSKDNLNINDIVKIQEYNSGELTGRIIEKKTDFENKIYTYVIEGLKEAVSAEIINEEVYSSKLNDGFDVINTWYSSEELNENSIIADLSYIENGTPKKGDTLISNTGFIFDVVNVNKNDIGEVLNISIKLRMKIKGDKGEQGIQGVKGDKGSDGKNAIILTSATTPNGEYDGQIGIWSGQFYQWDGNSWKLTSGILPTDPVLHYSFDDLPDLPDGGNIVYSRNKNWTGTDSFIGSATISVENGCLVFDGKGVSSYAYRGFGTHSNCFLKITMSYDRDGSFSIFENVATDTRLTTLTFEANEEKTVILKLSNNNRFVAISEFTGKITIKEFYIGDASYITPVIDNSGNNNNATDVKGLSVKGISGKSLYHIKEQQPIRCQNVVKNKNTDFSFSVWVKTKEIGIYGILGSRTHSWSNGWGLNKDNIFYISKNQIQYNLPVPTPADNKFHLIVGVYNNTTMISYFDGVKSSEIPITLFEGEQDDSSVYLGAVYGGLGSTFDGEFDDFQIFDRALFDQEVLGLYLAKGNTPKRFTLNDYRLNLIDDDGVISVSEKKELLRRWKEIYNAENVSSTLPTSNISSKGEYKAVIDSANSLNIGNITAIINYRESANALRDAFWGTGGYLNNMTTASILNGNLDSLFANYREALQNANNAISDQQSAQASAITVQMASPFIQLPVNESGNVTSYDNSGNIITILNGAETLTPVTSSATLQNNQYSVSASGSGIVAGSVSVDTTNKKVTIGNSTAMTKSNAQITYTVKFKINGTTGTLYAQQKISTASRGADGKRGGMYKGASTSAPTSGIVPEDFYLNKNDGYIYLYNGSTWSKITDYTDSKYLQAMNDMLSISNTSTNNSLITATNAHIQNLATGNVLANNILSKNLIIQNGGSIKTEVYSDDENNPKGAELDSNGNIKINGQLNTPILKVKKEKIEVLIKTFNPSNYQDAFESRNLIYYFKRFMAGTNDTNIPKYLKITCGGQIVKKIEMSLNSLHTISFIGENGVELDRVYIYNGRAVGDVNKYLTKTIQVYKYINDDYVLSLQNLETSGEFENIVCSSNGLIQLGGNHPLKKLIFPVGTKKSFIAAQIMASVLFEDVKKYTEFWRPCMGYYQKWEIISLRIKENSVGLQNKTNSQEWIMNIDDDSTIDSEIVLLLFS